MPAKVIRTNFFSTAEALQHIVPSLFPQFSGKKEKEFLWAPEATEEISWTPGTPGALRGPQETRRAQETRNKGMKFFLYKIRQGCTK
jgi:hypothetical protein